MGQAKQRGTFEERRAAAKPKVDPRVARFLAQRRGKSTASLVMMNRHNQLVDRARRHDKYPGSIVLNPKAKTFTINWSNNPRVNAGQRDVAEALVALLWRYVALEDGKDAELPKLLDQSGVQRR